MPVLSEGAPAQSFLRRGLARFPLAGFFLLAYGIAWGGIATLLISGWVAPAAIDASAVALLALPMLLGPSLGAVFVSVAAQGATGLPALASAARRWRADALALAVALFTTPVLVLVLLGAFAALLSPRYAPDFRPSGLLVGLVAGVCEEIGWTAFATPRLLQRFGVLKAGFVLGLAWAVWHVAADFAGNFASMGGVWPLWFLTFWLVPLTAYRTLMTWVYARARSLPLAQLMHAGYTGWLIALSPQLSVEQGLLWQAAFAASLWILVALVFATRPPEVPRSQARV